MSLNASSSINYFYFTYEGTTLTEKNPINAMPKPYTKNSAQRTLEVLNQANKVILSQEKTVQQIATEIYTGYQRKYQIKVGFCRKFLDSIKEFCGFSTERGKITKLYQKIMKRAPSIQVSIKELKKGKEDSIDQAPVIQDPIEPVSQKIAKNDLNNHSAALSSTPVNMRGGFANGGLTCYINAVLQCVRNSPLFCNYLIKSKINMQKFENESEEKFLLRQKIRDQLISIFQLSNTGKTVEAHELDNFRQLLNQYDPRISANGAGDRRESWEVLCTIFNLPQIQLKDEEDEPDSYGIPPCLSFNIQNPSDTLQTLINSPSSNIKDALAPLLAFVINRSSEFVIEPELYLEIKCLKESQPIKYRLVGLVEHPPFHFIAYVPDLDSAVNSWYCFNDSTKFALPELTANIKKDISMCFYERISKF